MSLTRALNQINIPTIQFPKELYQDLNHPLINQYDGFTDFPIPLLYQQLDQAHPGSKFIHTIRDEQKWLNSVQWLFSTGSIKFNLSDNRHAQTFHQAFYGTTLFDEDIFLNRYRQYNTEVAAYFADRPDDFLSIDLTAGEGYEKICPFLGLPIPDQPFPYTNKSENTGKVQLKKLHQKANKSLRQTGALTRIRPLYQTLRRILTPLPLTSQPERLSCQPFFIISTGRSGSTLLRAILNAHPTICIPPESHRLGPIVRQFKRRYRYQPWPYLPAIIAAEFQQTRGFVFWQMELAGFYQQAKKVPPADRNLARLIDIFYNQYRLSHKPEALRWGDKTFQNVIHLPEIEQLFPTAQYIHIIRDGRDVAASLFQQGLFPNPLSAAQEWAERVTIGQEFGQTLPDGRFLEIRYENLVQNPENTTQQLCDFLTLDYQPTMLNFWQNIDQLGDANRHLHQNLKNPINPSAIGKWKHQLNQTQQTLIQEQLRPILAILGYD